jgi:uncharacterized protein YyaL (SSP411 family)
MADKTTSKAHPNRPDAAGRPSNRLSRENSPYLRQHAHNPVDWYPWGDEAFDRARREDKPVFLSIGYSSCHWCHVMERESFDDAETARLLNETFVCVKVDREERPDLDQYYMTVGQMLTGAGGWPLTIVMTPDKRPFFAGTYFPKERRWGRLGLMEIVPQIAEAWRTRRGEILRAADGIVDAVVRAQAGARVDAGATGGTDIEGNAGSGQWQAPQEEAVPNEETRDRAQGEARPERGHGRGSRLALAPSLLDEAFRDFEADFDDLHGGFGSAPKFPTPHNLSFLLRYSKRAGSARALDMAVRTLDRMRLGGIHDHLGGGFHRYSTDAAWLVPHFEKMLYDQALLAVAYADAYAATGKDEFRETAASTLDYVLRDLASPEGGFYTAEDADSEGEEGRFYVWTKHEIEGMLGADDAHLAAAIFGIRAEGNFAAEAGQRPGGLNILHLEKPLAEPTADTVDTPAAASPGVAGFGELGIAHDKPASRIAAVKEKLLRARAQRVRPFRDTKILADWNGLAIGALARTARATGETRFLDAASRAARFVLDRMRLPDGRLLHAFTDGEARIPAYLDDYAFLIAGLIETYQADFDPFFLERALDLMKIAIGDFADGRRGGFFSVSAATELPVRAKEVYDGAVPSGNSVMLMNLLRLARLTGRRDLEETAERLTDAFADRIAAQPRYHAAFLCGLDYAFGPSAEVVIAGSRGDARTGALLSALARAYLPNAAALFKPAGEHEADGDAAGVSRPDISRGPRGVEAPAPFRADAAAGIAARLEALAPFTRDMKEVDGSPAAYVCMGGRCLRPVTTSGALLQLLREP